MAPPKFLKIIFYIYLLFFKLYLYIIYIKFILWKIIIKDKIKSLMETLIYKRDYSFFFAIRIFHHVNYHESVWGEINTKRQIRKHRLGNT